ncbi:LAME_0A01266g1_1 [Lachancea meyersii CBS 8951]|uniref:Putative transcription factor kapC n=1 Tax=Lachancea meyersii CBS 8951 TaxID=1266667 RepID=A0A1G4ILL7_9SACH|nr:LAME_0A01266g1_1 [Lachancea meyersii CBS 8951]
MQQMLPVHSMGHTSNEDSSNPDHRERNHANANSDPTAMVPASRNPTTTGVAVNMPMHLSSTNSGAGAGSGAGSGGGSGAGKGVLHNNTGHVTHADASLTMGQAVRGPNATGASAAAAASDKNGAVPAHSGLPLRHQNSMAMPPYMAQTASQLNAQFPMHNLMPIPPAQSPPSNSNDADRDENDSQLIGKSGKPLRNTKRAAQNRSAQKAFRQRRDRYIKDLETKVEEFDRLDAQVAALSQENESLKRYVMELEQRLMATRAP